MNSDLYQDIVNFVRESFESNDFIPLHEPRFIGKEREYVNDAIDSTFVSSVGKYVDRFEIEIAKKVGAGFAVATSNGTSALHIGLLMAGVDRDSIVITQALTFVATANAISYSGAEPVFVDVDIDTMGMSPDSLKAFLTDHVEIRNGVAYHKKKNKRIGACMPMHTFGFPCRIDEIHSICQEYAIPLVEDAAESLGSLYKGKHTGTFGEIGAYSFNGNKTVTCGGGGIIVTDNEEIAKKAKHITTTAKVPHRWEYVHDMVGYNYRMPNLNAAMACAQLEMLDAYVLNKRQLAQNYAEFFEGKDINFLTEGENTFANYWLMCVQVNSLKERDELLTYTNDNGVMTRPIWKLMTRLKMYENAEAHDLKNSMWLEERIVNIPSSVRI